MNKNGLHIIISFFLSAAYKCTEEYNDEISAQKSDSEIHEMNVGWVRHMCNNSTIHTHISFLFLFTKKAVSAQVNMWKVHCAPATGNQTRFRCRDTSESYNFLWACLSLSLSFSTYATILCTNNRKHEEQTTKETTYALRIPFGKKIGELK